jgi:hypothetical protein
MLYAVGRVIKHHCSNIERVHALAFPCRDEAQRIYVRDDGVRVGYCLRHVSAGIAESARYGWRPEWDVEAAA